MKLYCKHYYADVKKSFMCHRHQCPPGDEHLRLFTHTSHEYQQHSLEKGVEIHSVACQLLVASFSNFWYINYTPKEKFH